MLPGKNGERKREREKEKRPSVCLSADAPRKYNRVDIINCNCVGRLLKAVKISRGLRLEWVLHEWEGEGEKQKKKNTLIKISAFEIGGGGREKGRERKKDRDRQWGNKTKTEGKSIEINETSSISE